MVTLLQPARKRALRSLFSDEPADIPDFIHGETRPISIGLITSIPAPINARIFEPQNLSGWSFRAALGKGFLPPRAGSFPISYDGDLLGLNPGTTDPIPFDATAGTIQDKLNEILAVGAVAVTGSAGFFFIRFTALGARTMFYGDNTNLAPLSILDFGQLIAGGDTQYEVQTLRIVQNPGAYTSLSIQSDPASAAVVPLQAGGGGLNAKFRVYLAALQSGTLKTGALYTIISFSAGDDFTNVGAGSNATGVQFTATGTTPATWTNGSVLTRADPSTPYDGQWSLTVRGIESAMINFDEDQGTVQTAVENISLTAGLLVTGAKYKIVSFQTGDVFTNVGAVSNATGVVFVASGTTPTTWTNGSALSPVAAGNVSVFKEAQGQYLIVLKGDMANTSMGNVTADGSALKVIQTFAGVLDCRTSALDLQLDNNESAPVIYELEGTPPGGTVQKLFREDLTLLDSIIDPSDITPTPATSYLSLGGGNVLPTSDPHVVGQPWNNGNFVVISAG